MQIKLDLHLYAITRSWMDSIEYALFSSTTMAKNCNSEMDQYHYIKPVTVVADVPAMDVKELKVQGLRESLKMVRADYQARVTEIQSQINNLLALPMETKSEEDDIPF